MSNGSFNGQNDSAVGDPVPQAPIRKKRQQSLREHQRPSTTPTTQPTGEAHHVLNSEYLTAQTNVQHATVKTQGLPWNLPDQQSDGSRPGASVPPQPNDNSRFVYGNTVPHPYKPVTTPPVSHSPPKPLRKDQVYIFEFTCENKGLGIALSIGHHEPTAWKSMIQGNGVTYRRKASGDFFQIEELSTTHEFGLRCGDEVLAINDCMLDDFSLEYVGILLEEAAHCGQVKLAITRPKGSSFRSSDGSRHSRSNSIDSLMDSVSFGASSTDSKSEPISLSYSQPYDIELTKVEGGKNLGIGIVGGVDAPCGPIGFFVKTVYPNGLTAEDGRLKKGDEILALNGVALHGLQHSQAINRFKALPPGPVRLTVRCLVPSSASSGIESCGSSSVGYLDIGGKLDTGSDLLNEILYDCGMQQKLDLELSDVDEFPQREEPLVKIGDNTAYPPPPPARVISTTDNFLSRVTVTQTEANGFNNTGLFSSDFAKTNASSLVPVWPPLTATEKFTNTPSFNKATEDIFENKSVGLPSSVSNFSETFEHSDNGGMIVKQRTIKRYDDSAQMETYTGMNQRIEGLHKEATLGTSPSLKPEDVFSYYLSSKQSSNNCDQTLDYLEPPEEFTSSMFIDDISDAENGEDTGAEKRTDLHQNADVAPVWCDAHNAELIPSGFDAPKGFQDNKFVSENVDLFGSHFKGTAATDPSFPKPGHSMVDESAHKINAWPELAEDSLEFTGEAKSSNPFNASKIPELESEFGFGHQIDFQQDVDVDFEMKDFMQSEILTASQDSNLATVTNDNKGFASDAHLLLDSSENEAMTKMFNVNQRESMFHNEEIRLVSSLGASHISPNQKDDASMPWENSYSASGGSRDKFHAEDRAGTGYSKQIAENSINKEIGSMPPFQASNVMDEYIDDSMADAWLESCVTTSQLASPKPMPHIIEQQMDAATKPTTSRDALEYFDDFSLNANDLPFGRNTVSEPSVSDGLTDSFDPFASLPPPPLVIDSFDDIDDEDEPPPPLPETPPPPPLPCSPPPVSSSMANDLMFEEHLDFAMPNIDSKQLLHDNFSPEVLNETNSSSVQVQKMHEDGENAVVQRNLTSLDEEMTVPNSTENQIYEFSSWLHGDKGLQNSDGLPASNLQPIPKTSGSSKTEFDVASSGSVISPSVQSVSKTTLLSDEPTDKLTEASFQDASLASKGLEDLLEHPPLIGQNVAFQAVNDRSLKDDDKSKMMMTRNEHEPFLVKVNKNLSGLGLAVKVTNRGIIICNIQRMSPLWQNKSIRVNDYLLAVNGIRLHNQSAAEIQDILHNLPPGITRLTVSAQPPAPNPHPEDAYNQCVMPTASTAFTAKLEKKSTGDQQPVTLAEVDDRHQSTSSSSEMHELSESISAATLTPVSTASVTPLQGSDTFSSSKRTLSTDEVVSSVLKDYYTSEDKPQEEATSSKPKKPVIAQALLPRAKRSGSLVPGNSAMPDSRIRSGSLTPMSPVSLTPATIFHSGSMKPETMNQSFRSSNSITEITQDQSLAEEMTQDASNSVFEDNLEASYGLRVSANATNNWSFKAKKFIFEEHGNLTAAAQNNQSKNSKSETRSDTNLIGDSIQSVNAPERDDDDSASTVSESSSIHSAGVLSYENASADNGRFMADVETEFTKNVASSKSFFESMQSASKKPHIASYSRSSSGKVIEKVPTTVTGIKELKASDQPETVSMTNYGTAKQTNSDETAKNTESGESVPGNPVAVDSENINMSQSKAFFKSIENSKLNQTVVQSPSLPKDFSVKVQTSVASELPFKKGEMTKTYSNYFSKSDVLTEVKTSEKNLNLQYSPKSTSGEAEKKQSWKRNEVLEAKETELANSNDETKSDRINVDESKAFFRSKENITRKDNKPVVSAVKGLPVIRSKTASSESSFRPDFKVGQEFKSSQRPEQLPDTEEIHRPNLITSQKSNGVARTRETEEKPAADTVSDIELVKVTDTKAYFESLKPSAALPSRDKTKNVTIPKESAASNQQSVADRVNLAAREQVAGSDANQNQNTSLELDKPRAVVQPVFRRNSGQHGNAPTGGNRPPNLPTQKYLPVPSSAIIKPVSSTTAAPLQPAYRTAEQRAGKTSSGFAPVSSSASNSVGPLRNEKQLKNAEENKRQEVMNVESPVLIRRESPGQIKFQHKDAVEDPKLLSGVSSPSTNPETWAAPRRMPPPSPNRPPAPPSSSTAGAATAAISPTTPPVISGGTKSQKWKQFMASYSSMN